MLDEYVLLSLFCGIIILLSIQQRRRIKKYHEYMRIIPAGFGREEGNEKKQMQKNIRTGGLFNLELVMSMNLRIYL